eukprot:6457963-Amphidinium_carterae.2
MACTAGPVAEAVARTIGLKKPSISRNFPVRRLSTSPSSTLEPSSCAIRSVRGVSSEAARSKKAQHRKDLPERLCAYLRTESKHLFCTVEALAAHAKSRRRNVLADMFSSSAIVC